MPPPRAGLVPAISPAGPAGPGLFGGPGVVPGPRGRHGLRGRSLLLTGGGATARSTPEVGRSETSGPPRGRGRPGGLHLRLGRFWSCDRRPPRRQSSASGPAGNDRRQRLLPCLSLPGRLGRGLRARGAALLEERGLLLGRLLRLGSRGCVMRGGICAMGGLGAAPLRRRDHPRRGGRSPRSRGGRGHPGGGRPPCRPGPPGAWWPWLAPWAPGRRSPAAPGA